MTEASERRTVRWDGALTLAGRNGENVQEWQSIAAAAKAEEWSDLMVLLGDNPEMVNAVFTEGRSWFSLLHLAAASSAPRALIEDLIGAGAFRTARNSSGHRPVQIARSRGSFELVDILEPELKHPVDSELLPFMQELFHGLIRAAMLAYRVRHRLRLPELSVLTEFTDQALWFPIPGMTGGFHFWLEKEATQEVLIAESWCRINGGSGMRHRITGFEVILAESGFV